MTLQWHTYKPDSCCCLSKSGYPFKDMINAKNTCLPLAVNINGLHFKDIFAANRFADISTKQFPNSPTTPITETTTHNPTTKVTIQDIAVLVAAVSPGATPQNAPPVDGNQLQQTGSIINPASLPPDVKL